MSVSEKLPLVDSDGRERGTLTISCLPGGERWQGISTLDVLDDSSADTAGAKVRLLEECDYRYAIELQGAASIIAVEPRELVSPDAADGSAGRLRTGRTTGTVVMVISISDGRTLRCEVEVRSRKLDYETEYRRMMLRLAEQGAELVQASFAAGTFGGFNPDRDEDARTLYQRFAFLQTLLESERFDEAIETIRHRPHTEHSAHDELVDPARSMRPDRRLARQLVSASHRQPIHRPVAGMMSLPLTVTRHAYDETLDTVPNRFVRFALEHWKALASTVAELLELAASSNGSGNSRWAQRSAGEERGLREARRVEAELEHLLHIPALADAGRLEQFPASNTVLHSRSGYREIFRDFLIGEAATSLTWHGGEDVYGAGKRDVATLYEYWVFLELVAAIESIPGFTFDKSPLVAVTSNGLNLELTSGSAVALTGRGTSRGRTVELELHFNRTFAPSLRAGAASDSAAPNLRGDSSWTVTMRPDCSLRIRPEGGNGHADTWVHFDAKYRVTMGRLLDDGAGDTKEYRTVTGSTPAVERSATHPDLQKMHAYRDAIRRTAGAYVLYPGDDSDVPNQRRQFHEILPGLGAFALRPAEDGQASQATAAHLTRFLTDVIDHAASHGTSRERVRFWEEQAYATTGPDATEVQLDYLPALTRPPADSPILLGYVRGADHLDWINQQRLYNLRADHNRNGAVAGDSPALTASFVVLYDNNSEETTAFRTTGTLFVRKRSDLYASGYPTRDDGSGEETTYLCLELGEAVDLPVSGSTARSHAGPSGAPTVVTWDVLAPAPNPPAT